MIFSKCKKLCNHYHNLILEHSHHLQKEILHPFAVTHPLSPLPTHSLNFCFIQGPTAKVSLLTIFETNIASIPFFLNCLK